MPVGTLGSVKGVQQRDLEKEVGAQIILGNTYHLYLRPGTEVLEKAGVRIVGAALTNAPKDGSMGEYYG